MLLAATATAHKARIGGYFTRDGRALHRLTTFKASTAYQAKFDYGGRVIRAARVTFTARIVVRLDEAFASANP